MASHKLTSLGPLPATRYATKRLPFSSAFHVAAPIAATASTVPASSAPHHHRRHPTPPTCYSAPTHPHRHLAPPVPFSSRTTLLPFQTPHPPHLRPLTPRVDSLHVAAGISGKAGSSSSSAPFPEPPPVQAALPLPPADDSDTSEDDGPYVGPVPDLPMAMDALSYLRTFNQLGLFLQANSGLFRGPEVAAVVLQAANIAELAAERQMAAAMEVAERRAAGLTADPQGGSGKEGVSQDLLADTLNDWLAAATPPDTLSSGMYGTAQPGASGSGPLPGADAGAGVLAELDVCEQVLGWATPLLRSHVRRYPPDAVVALVVALSVLQSYDRPLMSAVAASFKADPAVWVARAAAGSVRGGDDEEGEDSGPGSDPWFILVSLVRAFSRLGHYDPDFMGAVARQAVAMLPSVRQRAELEDEQRKEEDDSRAEADSAAGVGVGGRVVGGGGVTAQAAELVLSYFELSHLEPELMESAGQHLASFPHQLDASTTAQVAAAFAALGATNPPFYDLMLRQVLTAPLDGFSPGDAGALYRACVLISDMGGVSALSPRQGPPDTSASATTTSTAADAAVDPHAVEAGDGALVGAALRELLSAVSAAFPASDLGAVRLGCPSPQQIAEAEAGMRELWAATGLMTVPQILNALDQLRSQLGQPFSLLPPQALAPPAALAASGGVVGGPDAAIWVPADVLLTYDIVDGDGAAAAGNAGQPSALRIAIKAIEERLHCCQTDDDTEGSSSRPLLPQVLTDPQKREVYDRFGEEGLKGGGPGMGGGMGGGGPSGGSFNFRRPFRPPVLRIRGIWRQHGGR